MTNYNEILKEIKTVLIENKHNILELKEKLKLQEMQLNKLNEIVWQNSENTILERISKVEELEDNIKNNQEAITRAGSQISQLFLFTITLLIGTIGYFIVRVESLPKSSVLASPQQDLPTLQRHH